MMKWETNEIGGDEPAAYLPIKAFNWKKNRIRQTVLISDGIHRFICTAYPHSEEKILYNSSVELSEKGESIVSFEFVETKDAKEVSVVGALPNTKYIGMVVKNDCYCFGKKVYSKDSGFLRITGKTVINRVKETLSFGIKEQEFVNFVNQKKHIVLVGPLDRLLFISKMSRIIKSKIFVVDLDHIDYERISTSKFIFIDKIDQIKDKQLRPVEKLFDQAIVIAAAMKFDRIPSSLRKMDRFTSFIEFLLPTDVERLDILKTLTKSLTLVDVELNKLVEETFGYTEGDLVRLIRNVSLQDEITFRDFQRQIKANPPTFTSSERHEEVAWSEIGGLENVKESLQKLTLWPRLHRDRFLKLGIQPSRGILLYGPPGTGKTKLIKALATSTKSTFLYMNTASIYSQYVGDSEESIRNIFEKARTSHPAVIFFDELDTLVGNRESEGTSGIEKRVLSTLLNEMDGIESLSTDVIFVGATNRPDMIDSALMRPGRLDFVLYVPPPSLKDRFEILKIYAGKMAVTDDILNKVVEITENYTGAELQGLCREAAMQSFSNDMPICLDHFLYAIQRIHPTLTLDLVHKYEMFQNSIIK